MWNPYLLDTLLFVYLFFIYQLLEFKFFKSKILLFQVHCHLSSTYHSVYYTLLNKYINWIVEYLVLGQIYIKWRLKSSFYKK